MSWVLLDRDGVINEDSDTYIKSPEEWVPIPGSLEAIAALQAGGFRVAVLTNQSGVARGLLDLQTLEAIHGKMRNLVEAAGGRIEHVFFCPHGPEDGCRCRKPNIGLFEQFAEQSGASLRGIPAIGDSLRDLQAAQAVGADPILVETGKGEKTLLRNPTLDVHTFANLYEAAQFLLFTHA
jgi:D-glycero-D-manno-heptose 1,7-bisphosphate phosphatase